MDMASPPTTDERAALPWDLDELPLDGVREQITGVASFVVWLRACDIEVPACWYTHGWVVRRLLALSYWHEAAHTPGSHPRDAADWWLALDAIRRDWEELTAHRGKHVAPGSPLERPQPIPTLDEVVEQWVAAPTDGVSRDGSQAR